MSVKRKVRVAVAPSLPGSALRARPARPRMRTEGTHDQIRGSTVASSVHGSVDDLCKKAVGLCTPGEMLGIAAASCVRGRPVTWDNSIRVLCIN